MPKSDANNLVFLNKSGVNIDMTRHYTRSKANERTIDSTPVNTPCSTTILSSMRLNRETTHTVYPDETTAKCFAEYLQNILIPTLSKDDIIVMDNMRSHHAKIVGKALDASEVRYLYLPSYSPYLNLLEKMWSKIKAYFKESKSL